MNLRSTLGLILAACVTSGRTEFTLPNDPAVLNVKTEFGARGDGTTDDSAALQAAFDSSTTPRSRAIYLPNGVYRVTRTLTYNIAVGPWIYGQSRDGVVIRLDDGVSGVLSVIRTHPRDQGGGSADWFMRNLRNFTVDVGNNPGVDGIRFFANNTGIIQNVRVIGNGNVGINAGFSDQSGPNIVQDVEVEGFARGIVMQWSWGGTISGATIRNCREVGVYVSANAVGIEDLRVEGTPLPLLVDYPNDWTWWGGVVSLIGADLRGTGPYAVHNRSHLYARDLRSSGFARAIRSDTPSGDRIGPTVPEFVSHPIRSAIGQATRALRLPVKREPPIDWENDPTKWLCADDYGAVSGDWQDDTDAIQRALDIAAALGKSVVYFRGVGPRDPNWFNLNGDVRVHGSVRWVLGLGWGRVLGPGRFIVDDRSAPVVRFQHIDAFGGPPPAIVHRGRGTVALDSCSVDVIGEGIGDIFMTNCPSNVDLRRPGQRLWARQLNPEGDSDAGLIRNRGGKLWALGVKSEGKGTRFNTFDHGQTEVAGMFMYTGDMDDADRRPMFRVTDAYLSVSGLREISFLNVFPIKLVEQQGRLRGELNNQTDGGWIAWSLFSNYRQPVAPTDRARD
jgi:hypothetical protein